jgi:hypothetical protein
MVPHPVRQNRLSEQATSVNLLMKSILFSSSTFLWTYMVRAGGDAEDSDSYSGPLF